MEKKNSWMVGNENLTHHNILSYSGKAFLWLDRN